MASPQVVSFFDFLFVIVNSVAPTHFGFDQIDCAKLFIALMRELSYGEGYWVQGGDWGAIVTGLVAHLDKNVKGYHTNFPLCMF
jgi:hypothetical protein